MCTQCGFIIVLKLWLDLSQSLYLSLIKKQYISTFGNLCSSYNTKNLVENIRYFAARKKPQKIIRIFFYFLYIFVVIWQDYALISLIFTLSTPTFQRLKFFTLKACSSHGAHLLKCFRCDLFTWVYNFLIQYAMQNFCRNLKFFTIKTQILVSVLFLNCFQSYFVFKIFYLF